MLNQQGEELLNSHPPQINGPMVEQWRSNEEHAGNLDATGSQ